MEQIFTFNAEITMRFSNLEEGYESTNSINQFKQELKPWMEEILRAAVLHMDDVKVSDVKVFQLE